MARFRIQYNNVREANLSEYQKLVLCYFLGRLSMESTDFVPEKTWIEIEKYGQPESGDILIKVYFVNDQLIQGYLVEFPFVEDTCVRQNSSSANPFAGVWVKKRYIKVETIRIKQITFEQIN